MSRTLKRCIGYAVCVATVAAIASYYYFGFGLIYSSVESGTMFILPTVAFIYGAVSYKLTSHIIFPQLIFSSLCFFVPIYSEMRHARRWGRINIAQLAPELRVAVLFALATVAISVLSAIIVKLYQRRKAFDEARRGRLCYVELGICAFIAFLHIACVEIQDEMSFSDGYWSLAYLAVFPFVLVVYGVCSAIITRRVLKPALFTLCASGVGYVIFLLYSMITEPFRYESFSLEMIFDLMISAVVISAIITVITLIGSALALFFIKLAKEDEALADDLTDTEQK